MIGPFNIQMSVSPLLLLAIMMFQCNAECSGGSGKNPGGPHLTNASMDERVARLAIEDSATNYLMDEDLDSFIIGRSKNEILQGLQWRSGFVWAADCGGTRSTAISYRLVADPGDPDRGISLHALFVDEKFTKFIRWLPDTEVVYDRGSPWSRRIRRGAGDYCEWLKRAMNSKTVTADDIKKELKSVTPPPKSVDPGLTAAYLGMRALGLAPGPPAKENAYEMLRENVALRNQFNAARLDLGMTESEVQATLKAKPLESGDVKAGHYQIYGSNKTFELWDWHHFPRFSNILVVFRDGKAIAIGSIDAGYDDWRKKLSEETNDLPEPVAKDSSGK